MTKILPLTKDLQFEKKNKDMIKLPKYAKVHKRPIPHAPVASPYANSSIPKIVYVSSASPFMSAVKRVQKLLRQAEKRATASIDLSNSKKREQQKLAQVARGHEQLQKEQVFVKATGRAMEKAMGVGRWFEQRGEEYVVRVKTGSVLVVDDVEDEDEEEKRERDQLRDQMGSEGGGGGGLDGGDKEGVVDSKSGAEEKKKKKKNQQKRAGNVPMEDSELPETRTRWVNMVEIAVSFK
ncbi:hypothetical protein FE257_012035 [Aspergillus nanangensis]|uniref:Uncharacterized protein n=1 Tax=Aspergillus nanangensis TaxID=2582783 RepID=A0AAD4CGJ8_ASPNN|nr:hypothetical protein FE257_012035 [Aspergillus nanangensis]